MSNAPDASSLSSVTIHPCGKKEASTVVFLVRAAFAEYDGSLDPPSSAQRESEEGVLRKMERARVLFASVEGVPVGCVFFEEQENAVYLFRLAVLPEYRNRGIGRQLLAAVEAETVAHPHLRTVRLSVRIALEQNRAYYERLGYHVMEYKCHPGYTEPTYVVMEKSV